jgi:hypothetical protein
VAARDWISCVRDRFWQDRLPSEKIALAELCGF